MPSPSRSRWARPGALAGGGHRARVGHGVRRRHGRPGGAAGDRPGAGRVAVRAAVDDLRLHPGAGVADPARRLARGPVRPPRVFLVGVAWFALASLVCGLAQTTGQLVAARVLQGVGGALLTRAAWPSSSPRSGPATAPRRSAWSALAGIAGLIGPFLGGVLVDAVSWRLVFLLNVPVAVLILAVSGRHVPESRDPAEHGGSTISGRRSAAWRSAGDLRAHRRRRAHARSDVVASAAVGLAAGVAFVVRATRGRPDAAAGTVRRPAVHRRQPGHPRRLRGARRQRLFLVLQLQTVLGYDATAAGAAMLPSILLLTLLSPTAGAVATRIGPRPPMTVGPLLVAAGTLLLAGLDGGGPYVIEVLPGSLLQGLGMAVVVTPLTATVLAAAPDALAGIASGVNNATAGRATAGGRRAARRGRSLRRRLRAAARLHRRLPDGDGGVRRGVRRRRRDLLVTIRNDVLEPDPAGRSHMPGRSDRSLPIW